MIRLYNLDQSLVDYINNLGMGVEQRGAIGGSIFYVEGNAGNDKYTGKEIDHAFQTLGAACAVSHADINRRARWAKRNTIYVFGDALDEDLVAFPQKTDIVGLGSYDANTMAGLIGNHAPLNTAYGTRFFNMWLKGPAVASPLLTLTNATSGVQLIGCTLSAAAETTIGVQATAHPFLKLIGNRFEGAFATSYVTLGAGEAGGLEIIGNRMVDAAAAGIVINASTTFTWKGYLMNNPLIQATTLCLDDNSDKLYWIGNNFITAAAVEAGYAAALDVNAKLGANNYLTADNVANVLVPVVDTST